MFHNFETMFYQIKNVLLDSPELKKLIFYNTPNALERAEPTYAECRSSIYIKPIIYIYDDSPEFGISSFISIGLIEAVIHDGSISSSIKISIVCNREVWELDNNRVRPLAIVSEAEKQLNNTKLGMAGKLELKVLKEVYFNNDSIGYTMLFDIKEEIGDVVHDF